MPNLTWYGSPNFTPGRTDVEFVVIHWMDGYLAAADATFQNTVRQTSAHYGVEDDTIHQYVDEANTAWHAGDFEANRRSIGIEHSAMPGRPASDATYASAIWLITGICQRYGLDPAVAILPHQHFTSTDCPGTMDLPRIIAGVQGALGGASTQSGTITPITEGFLMTLSDADQIEVRDNLRKLATYLVPGNGTSADLSEVTLNVRKVVAGMGALPNAILTQPVKVAGQDRTTSLATEVAYLSPNFNTVTAAVAKTQTAPAAVDVESLAASVAAKINAAQADSFIAALRAQINK
jgi:hypothetical protein